MDGVAYVQELCLQLIAACGTLLGALVIFWLTKDAQREAAKEEVREQWKLFSRASNIQFLQWEGERKLEALQADLNRASSHLDIANTVRVELDRIEKELLYAKSFPPAVPLDTTLLDAMQREYVGLPYDLASDAAHVHTSVRQVNLLGTGPWTPAHDALLVHVQAAMLLFKTRTGELQFAKNQASARVRLDELDIKRRISEAMSESPR